VCNAGIVPDSTLSFDPIEEAGNHWRERWGEDSVTPMVAVTSIMRAQQILMARLNATLEPFSLTFPRYEALMLLLVSRRGALPLGKMGDRLQVHRTSVTNLIDGLERLGYAQRSPHPTDRRTTLATITEAGRAAAAAATEALNAERYGTDPLEDEELRELTDVLRRFRIGAQDFDG
jgi:DNA-binding MarR family transcriptional regulator